MAIVDEGVIVGAAPRGPSTKRHPGQGSSLRITVNYANYGKATVYVKSQNNMTFAVMQNEQLVSADEPREHLEIAYTYELLTPENIYETYQLLNGLVHSNALMSEEAAELKDTLREIFQNDANRKGRHRLTFEITRRVLHSDIKRTDSLYIREADIVVSTQMKEIAKPHPNSKEGLQTIEVNKNERYRDYGGLFILVVDNDHLAKVRYIYLGKKLVEIPSIVDKSKESGVYYTFNSMDDTSSVSPESKFCTFKEAEALIGLYRHKEDAITWGSVDTLKAAELAQLRENEAKLRHEFEMEKLENERLLTSARQELAMLKEMSGARVLERTDVSEASKHTLVQNQFMMELEKARTQIETDRRKVKAEKRKYKAEMKKLRSESKKRERDDYYDSRSAARKDTSEVWKFLPAMLLGGLGLFMAGRKTA